MTKPAGRRTAVSTSWRIPSDSAVFSPSTTPHRPRLGPSSRGRRYCGWNFTGKVQRHGEKPSKVELAGAAISVPSCLLRQGMVRLRRARRSRLAEEPPPRPHCAQPLQTLRHPVKSSNLISVLSVTSVSILRMTKRFPFSCRPFFGFFSVLSVTSVSILRMAKRFPFSYRPFLSFFSVSLCLCGEQTPPVTR